RFLTGPGACSSRPDGTVGRCSRGDRVRSSAPVAASESDFASTLSYAMRSAFACQHIPTSGCVLGASERLVDTQVIAGRVAERAVAHAVRLVDRLLHDLRAA